MTIGKGIAIAGMWLAMGIMVSSGMGLVPKYGVHEFSAWMVMPAVFTLWAWFDKK